MSKRLRVLLAVSFGISAAIALTVWLLGFDGAANAIGLLTAALGMGSALLGWLVPNADPRGPQPAVDGVRTTGDADPVGTDSARRAVPRPAAPPDPPRPTSAARARRWAFVAAASLAPVLLVAGVSVVLLVERWDDGRSARPGAALDGTASPEPVPGATGVTPSGVASGSAAPAASGTPGTADPTGQITPIVDPPPPPSPTRKSRGTTTPRPENSVRVGQPWDPPAGTPEWTLYDTDGVHFLPRPTYLARVGATDLTFQLNMHQINWYQWTDSDDLSYQGCRNPAADRWDGLKLDLFAAPRTYCRQEPDDPSKVSYVQFTAKDMNADPPYVKVRVWVHSP